MARTLQCCSKMEVTYLKGLFWWEIHLSLIQNVTGSEIEVFKTYFGSDDVRTVHPYIHSVQTPVR